MKKIVVGFSRAKDPLKIGSYIIRLVEKRPYSHVYIKYVSTCSGIPLVAQASHGFVNHTNYGLFEKDNNIIEEYELNCTPEQFKEVVKFIHNNLGKKYGTFQLFFIAIKKLFNMQVDIKDADSHFICSEFGARICTILGIGISTMPDYITPSDINEILNSHNILRLK